MCQTDNRWGRGRSRERLYKARGDSFYNVGTLNSTFHIYFKNRNKAGWVFSRLVDAVQGDLPCHCTRELQSTRSSVHVREFPTLTVKASFCLATKITRSPVWPNHYDGLPTDHWACLKNTLLCDQYQRPQNGSPQPTHPSEGASVCSPQFAATQPMFRQDYEN